MAAATILGACTSIPQLDIESPVTVANIVDRIECEAWTARERHPQLLSQKWIGQADLYLQVDDSAGLEPSLTFIKPLMEEGTKFTFGVNATLKRTRQRLYNESIKIDMTKLNESTCKQARTNYDLAGDLGIIDTLDIGLRSFDKIDEEHGVAFSDKEAIGQTLQFVLTRNVNGVGPTWTLSHFIGPGGLAGAERIDTHKLIVTFTPSVKTVIVSENGHPVRKSILVSPGNASDRASINNQKLLIQSLPGLQQLR